MLLLYYLLIYRFFVILHCLFICFILHYLTLFSICCFVVHCLLVCHVTSFVLPRYSFVYTRIQITSTVSKLYCCSRALYRARVRTFALISVNLAGRNIRLGLFPGTKSIKAGVRGRRGGKGDQRTKGERRSLRKSVYEVFMHIQRDNIEEKLIVGISSKAK